ncbi:hypothetical protein LCGC14_0900830 [marine sediment metagenome]|uniref:Uncharacterized protein n=1 Tax=marine sediment metagenome TaxID=412755 RepID=A0A0F9S3F3_9ZZZZ
MHDKKTGQKITQEDIDYAAYLANLQTVRINTMRQWEKTTDFTASAAVKTMEHKMDNEDNRIYVITHVAASDDTTGTKTIQLYNVKAGQKHLLNSDITSGIKVSVNWDGELISGPNQSVIAVFTTPTNGDKLKFTVSGYWVPA